MELQIGLRDIVRVGHVVVDAGSPIGERGCRVCGELLIFEQDQQFATQDMAPIARSGQIDLQQKTASTERVIP